MSCPYFVNKLPYLIYWDNRNVNIKETDAFVPKTSPLGFPLIAYCLMLHDSLTSFNFLFFFHLFGAWSIHSCLGRGDGSFGNKGVKHTLTSLSDRLWLLNPGSGERGEGNWSRKEQKDRFRYGSKCMKKSVLPSPKGCCWTFEGLSHICVRSLGASSCCQMLGFKVI